MQGIDLHNAWLQIISSLGEITISNVLMLKMITFLSSNIDQVVEEGTKPYALPLIIQYSKPESYL